MNNEFIKCINYYINHQQLNNEFNKDLLKLAIDQSLQTILYPVYKNDLYKKYYVSWVLKQEAFNEIEKEVSKILNENNIDHFYFKGAILSKIYDDPSVRTRGDIDLYVGYDNFDKAKKLLIDNVYILDNQMIDNMHHQSLSKNDIEVELHFSLFDTDVNKKWFELFKNPFEFCVKVNDNLYQLDDTYHFVYCILHFAHHLRHGAGLRYMLDFYYMFNKTNIDKKLFYDLINKLEINKLYNNIINVMRYIFNIDFDNNVESIDINYFIDYMLSYGIHGNASNDTSYQASHDNKFKYVLSRIFITNKNYRILRYPILGKHWYLYPICLIKHWLYLITHKIGGFFKVIFGKNKNKDLYKKLGI